MSVIQLGRQGSAYCGGGLLGATCGLPFFLGHFVRGQATRLGFGLRGRDCAPQVLSGLPSGFSPRHFSGGLERRGLIFPECAVQRRPTYPPSLLRLQAPSRQPLLLGKDSHQESLLFRHHLRVHVV